MNARRPLISAVVAIAVVGSVALIAAADSASPSRSPSQPTAVELTQEVAQVSFDGLPANLPVFSFTWGGRNTTSGPVGGGGGTGKAILNGFTLTRKLDESSPLFLRRFLTGQLTKTVTLEVFDGPGSRQVAMKYTLSNVLISSFAHSGLGTADYSMPFDRMTLKFHKVCLQTFSPPGARASTTCFTLST
jgi:type VI protein secretion system component Hcp